jgi:hypothetical protein
MFSRLLAILLLLTSLTLPALAVQPDEVLDDLLWSSGPASCQRK